jgi:hypothetical protein
LQALAAPARFDPQAFSVLGKRNVALLSGECEQWPSLHALIIAPLSNGLVLRKLDQTGLSA